MGFSLVAVCRAHRIPPTSPGPPPAPSPRFSRIFLGVLIHCGCIGLSCFVVPLAMNSIIWPIAGVFWSAITVPGAAGSGALIGWMLKNRSTGVAVSALALSGIALAVAVGLIMAKNQ